MITFKYPEDLSKLPPSDSAYPVIKDLVESLIVAYTTPERPYVPEDDGYIVLIEEGDVDRLIDLPEVGCSLLKVFWEGAFKKDGFYVAIYLANDEFGISFVIPDTPWIKGDLRELLDELVSY